MININRYKRTKFQWILLAVSAFTMLTILLLLRNNHIQPDSPGYIQMLIQRDPFYPLFIAFFRWIFGESYIYPMLITQNIIFAIAVWQFVVFIQDRFNLSAFSAVFMQFICFSCTVFINIIFSSSSQHYMNLVLTEGITISLFYFCMRYVMSAAVNLNYNDMRKAIPFITIAMLARMQMSWMAVLWLIVFVYIAICKEELKRRAISIIAVFLGLFVFAGLFTRTYHLIINGRFVSTQFSSSSILTKMLYISDSEDANLFNDDPEAKELFEKVYFPIYEERLTYLHAEGGFYDKHNHYADSYDLILYGNLNPVKYVLATDQRYDNHNDKMIYGEQLCSRMIAPLLRANAAEYIAVTTRALIDGILKSVFWIEEGIGIYGLITAILACTLYVFLLAAVIKKNKESSGPVIAIIMLIAMMGNIAPNVLTHWLHNRYTIYTIGMFYAVMLVMISELRLKPLRFLNERQKNA